MLISSKKSNSSRKEKDKDFSVASLAPDHPPPPLPISPAVATSITGYKKLSSLSLDPKGVVTLQARVIRF